jgi:acid stress-induced BolA-like protein IbaG/YrbA
MTLNEIQIAILNTQLSNDELNILADAIKFKRAQVGKEVARSLRIGSQVKFTDSRSGRIYTGTLEAIKIKNATVNTTMGRYRVPMNMLSEA